jgi:hypothetical protein
VDELARELELQAFGEEEGNGPRSAEPEDLPPETIKKRGGDEETDEEAMAAAMGGVTKKGKGKKARGPSAPPAPAAAKGKSPGRKKGGKIKAESTAEEKQAEEAARIKAAQELLEAPLQPTLATGNLETDMEEMLRWVNDSEYRICNALLTMQSERAPAFMARSAEVLRQTAIHMRAIMRRYQETHRAYVGLVYNRQRMPQFGQQKGVVALGPVSK